MRLFDYFAYYEPKRGPIKVGDSPFIFNQAMADLVNVMHGNRKHSWGDFDSEIAILKEHNMVAIFKEEKNAFFDADGNPIDIKGKSILGRSMMHDELIAKIIEHGGKSLCEVGDFDRTCQWWKTVDVDRNIKETTFKEIVGSAKSYKEGDKIFVKTIRKTQLAGVCIIKNGVWHHVEDNVRLTDFNVHTKLGHDHKWMDCDPDEPMLTADALELVGEVEGLKTEWRAFVVNNELVALNRYDHMYLPCTDKEKISFFENAAKRYKGKLPASYCVDAMETKGGTLVITEFNPIAYAGKAQFVLTGVDYFEHHPELNIERLERMKPDFKYTEKKVEKTIKAVSEGMSSIVITDSSFEDFLKTAKIKPITPDAE